MTIDITHALSVEIASAFGVWIGSTRSQEHREKIERSADEFVRSLPEGWRDNIRELLQDTITRWSPTPTFPPVSDENNGASSTPNGSR